MTLTQPKWQTDVGFKAQKRLVNHNLDDKKVNKVLSNAREALRTYGAMDAFAAIVLTLNCEDES